MVQRITALLKKIVLWFDTSAVDREAMTDTTVVDWYRVIPFIAVHAACLGVIWVWNSLGSIGARSGLSERGRPLPPRP